MICTFILFGLTIYEVQNYLNAESRAELIVDTSHRDDFVNVNIDILFPKVPCDVLSLDVQDILGTHKADVMGDLNKYRVDAKGVVLSKESAIERSDFRGNIKDRVKKELE